MKATELRIGNLIHTDNSTQSFMDVVTVDLEVLLSLHYGYGFYENPIPLTEEWLVKFGFDKIGIYYEKENLRIEPMVLMNLTFAVRFITGVNSSIMISSVQHVHQLQNLYFALTGEELTI